LLRITAQESGSRGFQPAVWHSDTELEAPLNVEGLLWVRNYFNIKETKKYYGAAVYKMERR